MTFENIRQFGLFEVHAKLITIRQVPPYSVGYLFIVRIYSIRISL